MDALAPSIGELDWCRGIWNGKVPAVWAWLGRQGGGRGRAVGGMAPASIAKEGVTTT